MTHDAVIVGAGPIGIEMASVLKRAGASFVHLEAGAIGDTITRWPRNTRFFSSPEWIAIAGIPIQTEGQEIVTGEHYLSYLRQVIEILDLDVRTYERVVSASGNAGAFVVETVLLSGERGRFECRNIVLATGDMNRPRTLGIPGEELPHVTHLWSDPHLYFQRRLLIVGGRNSAVEAAIRCWRSGVKVAISYRGERLDEKRLISRLYLEIDLLIRNGQIEFYPLSEPVEISPGRVVLRRLRGASDGESPASTTSVDADFVYLATGFEMDYSLYDTLGVATAGDERKPVHDPTTMESNVPGVYVVGTSVGGNQRGYKVFITTSHAHCLAAARSLLPGAAIDPRWVGNIAVRDYPLSSRDVE